MKHIKKFESFSNNDLSNEYSGFNEKKKSSSIKDEVAKKRAARKAEKDCEDDEDCETPKGLTKAQLKLPEGLRNAILKRKKK